MTQPTFGLGSTQTGPGASIFGGAPQGSQTQAAGQQPDGTSEIRNRDPAYFRSLLERQSKKGRVSRGQPGGRASPLPTLNVDLGDLARRAQEIGNRVAEPSRPGTDSRAHYVLAGSGVAPGKAYRDFQTLAGAEDEDITRPQIDFGEDASRRYMRDLQQRGREAMMKESMDRVYREVDAFIQETLGIDFEEQQRKIMEHFGIVSRNEDSSGPRGSFGRSTRPAKGAGQSEKSATRSIFGRSGLDKSMIGTPGKISSFFGEDSHPQHASTLFRGQTARDLRDKERLYLESVEQLNRARMDGKSFPILHNFARIEETVGGESPRQLVDAYQTLAEIVKEPASSQTSPVIKERHYAASYHDDNLHSPAMIKLKRQIIDGSRTHLEKIFYRDLESLVEKNPREAQLGGRPTVTNKVRAYIRVRAALKDLAPEGTELQQVGEHGEYCWILIFYLIRSGHVRDALEYVENDPAFQSTDKRFVSYLKSYCSNPDRKLSRKLQEMVNGEYSQRAKLAPVGSVDPYRMACYKVVGRCDLSSRNLDVIGQGVEDWIWLQFSLAREMDLDDLPGDSYGLDQICETITEIGQKHFQKTQIENSGAFGTFFLMQIMSGMFEQAVDYLNSFSPVSAVHFAIALAYYGLLRVSHYSTAGNELCKSYSKESDAVTDAHSDLLNNEQAPDQLRPSCCVLHGSVQDCLTGSCGGLPHFDLSQFRLDTRFPRGCSDFGVP